MTALAQHPLSAAFPSMPEQELQALALDIEKHGQREPGVMFEGKVLDGWHRYLACQAVNVKFKAEEYEGDDAVAFVISRNLHRRHLTASQRAAAVVAASAWRSGAGRPAGNSAPGAELSSKALSEKAEVSERTIEHAKTAHRAGLGEKVREGALSAKKAAEMASGKKTTRKAKPAPDPEAEKFAPDLAEELERADKQIREQQELIDSLKKDDLSKEVAKWKQKYDQLNGRVQQLATTAAEAQKTAQYQADLIAKIRKALKVEKNSEILPALKR